MESISKYNFHGIEYVEMDELNKLIYEMKEATREGVKPGYICDDEGQRTSAYLALNHLQAVLNKEAHRVKMHERLEATRIAREDEHGTK